MISPTTVQVLKFMRDVLELRMTPFQEDMIDAMVKCAKPLSERVVLRSRDGLELVTKVPYGVCSHTRPLVPSTEPITPKSTMAAALFAPRSREYMDCGLTRIHSVPGAGSMRILEER